MKNALCCLLLVGVFCCAGCDDRASSSYAGTVEEDEYDKQVKEYDRQMKEGDRQLEENQRQLKESQRQLEVAEKQAERYEKLLKRWEEQADRQDRILQRQERLLDKQEREVSDVIGPMFLQPQKIGFTPEAAEVPPELLENHLWMDLIDDRPRQ